MPTSQSDDDVEPNILSGPQLLCFSTVAWCNESGFSSMLVDKDIETGLMKPLPSPAMALQDCYRILKSPGKGLGMFATKDINPGDHILVENPLLVVPKQIMPNFPLPPSIIYNILIAAYQDTPAFDAFFSLHNCYPLTEGSLPFHEFVEAMQNVTSKDLVIARGPFTCNASVSPEDVTIPDVKDAKAIAETNALDIQIQDPKWNSALSFTHRAVFLNASRINHRYKHNIF
jgi:hypothetical protein